MAEGKLNLFDRRLARVREFGKSAAHVVGRERRPQLPAVCCDDRIDRLGAHALPGDAVALVHGAEHQTLGEASGCQPCIHRSLRPGRHGNGPDAVPLARQVHNAPAAVALLNVFDPQRGEFLPAQAAAHQQSEQRAIALPLFGFGVG